MREVDGCSLVVVIYCDIWRLFVCGYKNKDDRWKLTEKGFTLCVLVVQKYIVVGRKKRCWLTDDICLKNFVFVTVWLKILCVLLCRRAFVVQKPSCSFVTAFVPARP